MSSGATGFDSKTYEQLKYFYNTQAWLPKNAVIVNLKAFDALDKPTQVAVLNAAAEAEARGWSLSEEKNGWYVDQLKQKGMGIEKPSEQLNSDLRRVGNYMLAERQHKAGSDGKRSSTPIAWQYAVRAASIAVPRRRCHGGVVFGRDIGDGPGRHCRPAAQFQPPGTDAYAGYAWPPRGFSHWRTR
jgi:hypothetical protein